MTPIAFFAAAGLSALWAGVHLVLGGRQVAGPLRATSDAALDPMARDTAWLCWHFVTGALILMALLFLGAALGGATGLSATALAATFALAGLILPPLMGQSYRVLPQGWLFVPVAALGLWGMLG